MSTHIGHVTRTCQPHEVAAIAMLGRELGWGRAAAISGGTIAVALLVGGVVSHALALL